MFTKILVPTDGTAFSAMAVAGAIDYARTTGATLIGLTVNELLSPFVDDDEWTATLPSIVDQNKKRMAENLAAVDREFEAAGVPHEMAFVDDEHPWKAILETAKRYGCDAIFMASHGRHGFDTLMLGSETHKVLTHTTLPVLVFR